MHTMPRAVFPTLLLLLLLLSVLGASQACLPDPASAYRFTGAVCRLTYPAAVVCEWVFFILNQFNHSFFRLKRLPIFL